VLIQPVRNGVWREASLVAVLTCGLPVPACFQGQHYERWSHYANGDKTGINSERRGEGRRLRRQRRKERHRQQEHEWAVAAVAAALKGEALPAMDDTSEADAGTVRRRSRAARLANALGGPDGWAATAKDGAEATWGITGDSRYAKMRKALREEAAARLAAQLAGRVTLGGESYEKDPVQPFTLYGTI
jgi:hypothetical protein